MGYTGSSHCFILAHTLRPYHRCCMGGGKHRDSKAEGIRTGAAPFALHTEVNNWGRHHCADFGRGETSETDTKTSFLPLKYISVEYSASLKAASA